MVGFARQGQFGLPVKLPKSNYTQERVLPTAGYTDLGDVQAPPASLTSGQNVWIYQGRITPRPRLQQLGDVNILQDAGVGAFLYNDVTGVQYPIVASKHTIAVLVAGAWNPLVYQSGTSNFPMSGGQNDLVFGASVYLPRVDQNVAFITNGIDPVFEALPSVNPYTFSTGTQTLIAKDICEFDTRLMYWNVRYASSVSQLVTRVAWSVKGNPEDITSVGAGYQDLFDMRGIGTRIFPRVNEVVVASDQEIWRGSAIGPPFDFQFDPFSKVLGIPYPRAAINTPEGLFWVGSDFMVYRLQPYYWSQVEPVGKAIQRTLHNEVGDPNTFFFGYHADAKQLALYYQRSGDTSPRKAYTFNTMMEVWSPQLFTHGLTIGFTSPVNSGATVWNSLIGGFCTQTQTYQQLLGENSEFNEAAVSSGGTVYVHIDPRLQPTDDGVAVYEEAQLGAFFAAMPERRKFCDEVRVDVQADVLSQLTIQVAGNSSGNSSATNFSISANSGSSQYRAKLAGISDTWHQVEVQSTGGAWNVLAVTARAKIEGEAI